MNHERYLYPKLENIATYIANYEIQCAQKRKGPAAKWYEAGAGDHGAGNRDHLNVACHHHTLDCPPAELLPLRLRTQESAGSVDE